MSKQRKSREAFEEKRTHGKQSTEYFDCNNYNTQSSNSSRNKIHTEIYELIGTGEQNAIHQKELVNLTGLAVRDITSSIEYLRRSGKVILSSCNGYFKPETMAEVDAHIKRERSRANNILKTLETVRGYKQKAINELRKNKRIKETYGEEVEFKHITLASFKRTWTSSTELAALRVMESEKQNT